METNQIKLLKSKNRCLRELNLISSDFLSRISSSGTTEAEAEHFLPSVELFMQNRKALFKMLFFFDRQLKTNPRTEAETPSSEILEAEKDSKALIQAALITDQKIYELVESRKLELLSALTRAGKSDQVIRKFKSKWVNDSGGRLDGTV